MLIWNLKRYIEWVFAWISFLEVRAFIDNPLELCSRNGKCVDQGINNESSLNFVSFVDESLLLEKASHKTLEGRRIYLKILSEIEIKYFHLHIVALKAQVAEQKFFRIFKVNSKLFATLGSDTIEKLLLLLAF